MIRSALLKSPRVDVGVAAADLMTLPDGSFYHHDLVGCVVETREGQIMGAVTGVEGASGTYRLSVAPSEDAGAQFEVPLAEPICTRIDPEAGVIVVDLPDGLVDLNRRR